MAIVVEAESRADIVNNKRVALTETLLMLRFELGPELCIIVYRIDCID